jgi:hypothetical protein
MAVVFTRAELVKLFWESDAPKALSQFCTMHRLIAYKLPEFRITTEPEPLDYAIDLRDCTEEVIFHLEGRTFGNDEIWISVIAKGMVIVAPIPLAQREFLELSRPTCAELEASNLC